MIKNGKAVNTKPIKTNTNSLTQSILKTLPSLGFKAWRNNNGAVYDTKKNIYRKNPTTLLGVSDIIGYRKKDGKTLFIEIKTGKDVLSTWQIDFLAEAKRAGCFAFVAKTYEDLENNVNYLRS